MSKAQALMSNWRAAFSLLGELGALA